jgi:hypothetical protein
MTLQAYSESITGQVLPPFSWPPSIPPTHKSLGDDFSEREASIGEDSVAAALTPHPVAGVYLLEEKGWEYLGGFFAG